MIFDLNIKMERFSIKIAPKLIIFDYSWDKKETNKLLDLFVSFVIAKHYRYHTITSAYSSYRHIKRLYFPNFIAAKQKTV